jgi:hypothetical protein
MSLGIILSMNEVEILIFMDEFERVIHGRVLK